MVGHDQLRIQDERLSWYAKSLGTSRPASWFPIGIAANRTQIAVNQGKSG